VSTCSFDFGFLRGRRGALWPVMARVGLLCGVCSLASVIACGQAAVRTASVRGIVLDQQGGAIQNATVILLNSAAVRLQETKTDGRGAFAFPDVRPGAYVVEVERSGFARLDKSITIAPG